MSNLTDFSTKRPARRDGRRSSVPAPRDRFAFEMFRTYRQLSANDQLLVREFVSSLSKTPDRRADPLSAQGQQLTPAHHAQIQNHLALLLEVQKTTGEER